MANTDVRYCPYCGCSNLSLLNGGVLCLSCGSSFATSRGPSESMTQARQHVNTIGPSTLPLLADALARPLRTLNVPPIIRDSARAIYRRAIASTPAPIEKRIARALASAAIYAAYKKSGQSKSIDKIAAASGVEKAETEQYYTFLLNEMGYFSSMLSKNEPQTIIEPEDVRWKVGQTAWREEGNQASYVEKFLEKKGTYEFLRILRGSPKRWKTLEKELMLSPRTLSERITQALELGFIEKIRRLKIGATYYRLTRKGNEILEAMTENTNIY